MTALNIPSLSAPERKTIEVYHSSWPLSILPSAMKPYAELIRIHKPAGILVFYFPCLHGTLLVGCLSHNIDLVSMNVVNIKLFLLSFLLRGALCTWNDIVDQDIDRQVARTRIRPIPRGATSTQMAVVWTLVQFVSILGMFFLALPWDCLLYALPFLGLHIIYPFAKRLTHHPQVILGLALSLGVFISFPALGQSITLDSGPGSRNTAGALYLSSSTILWALLSDTIYAAQDVEVDRKAGVGSTMVYWDGAARNFLRVLASFQLVSLLALAFIIGPGDGTAVGRMIYTACTCGGTALVLITLTETVNLEEPASCAWWFNRGHLLVGCSVASGLLGNYIMKLY